MIRKTERKQVFSSTLVQKVPPQKTKTKTKTQPCLEKPKQQKTSSRALCSKKEGINYCKVAAKLREARIRNVI